MCVYVHSCGVWVLCGVYVGVGMGVVWCVCWCGYGCFVVCMLVWGMGVVWCVPQYKLVGYVRICMHVLVCPCSCSSGLCLKSYNTCIHIHMNAMCVMYSVGLCDNRSNIIMIFCDIFTKLSRYSISL